MICGGTFAVTRGFDIVMNLIPGVRNDSHDWITWKNTITHNRPLS